jgi:serine/threonine protein kinase
VDETIKSSKGPRKVDRYEIKSELGRGGMATVYLGYDARFEREVAVKVLPAEFLHDPQFSVRFHREAKIIATLEHPAIVPVYDVGETDGVPYFVMRYMDGGSLADLLAEGEPDMKEVARIINAIAPALDEAHRRGIIHRDLKPANILFDRGKQPYLSDFGIAKMSDSQTNVTGSAIIGTPAYMSPEQAQGRKVDGRSDVYALGAIVYRMLTGARPFEGDTPMSMAIKHITDPTPDILKDNADLPVAASNFIYHAMAKEPDERFQTAAELAEALNALAYDGKVVQPKTLLGRTRIAKKSGIAAPKSKMGWIVAGVLVIALGGMGLLSKFIFPPSAGEQTSTPITGGGAASTATKPAPPPASPAVEATPSLIPSPTVEPTPDALILGGADKIAFLGNNNVWMMNVDGTELEQLTTDGAQKSKLQWLPDGNTLIYVVGKCIQMMDVKADRVDVVTCFEQADYFEAFQVSPSGEQIAVSVNRELFIVPFDLEKFKTARTRNDLGEMGGCFYIDTAIKDVRWSNDEQILSVVFLDVVDGHQIDTIRIVDISDCEKGVFDRLDEFPAQRFTMSSYNSGAPTIPSFDWDGGDLYLMNTNKRNDGFGYWYSYNARTHKAVQLDPMQATCCYRDAHWSPDGSYFMVAFQDIALGANAPIELYYLRYGTLEAGGTYTQIEMPEGFFTNRKESPQFALRPVQ